MRVGVTEDDRRRVYERRLANDPAETTRDLRSMKTGLVGLVVESTYNWYCMVDALMDEGYKVHPANPLCDEDVQGPQAYR